MDKGKFDHSKRACKSGRCTAQEKIDSTNLRTFIAVVGLLQQGEGNYHIQNTEEELVRKDTMASRI